MGEKGTNDNKVLLGVRMSRGLKQGLQEQALAEKRPDSQFCEIVLEWGLEQVRKAGNSIELQKYSVHIPGQRSIAESEVANEQRTVGKRRSEK